MDKIFLKECFLQKTNQYEALDVLSKDENDLRLGSFLFLCFDEKKDKEKKLVFAKTKVKDGNIEGEEKTIGILSEEDAKEIKPYLEVGRMDLYECRISKFDKDGDENKRFSIAIFIVSKDYVNRQQGKARR
ncbi:MAG: hypothetical protein Q4A50_01770 [Bacteroidales bacterium]|nr:hypothetical protein [Bacteroidales bacterium]